MMANREQAITVERYNEYQAEDVLVGNVLEDFTNDIITLLAAEKVFQSEGNRGCKSLV
jgi:hypothetical protein